MWILFFWSSGAPLVSMTYYYGTSSVSESGSICFDVINERINKGVLIVPRITRLGLAIVPFTEGWYTFRICSKLLMVVQPLKHSESDSQDYAPLTLRSGTTKNTGQGLWANCDTDVYKSLVRLDSPRDHVSAAAIELHWLPIEFRIQYKICLLVHLSLNGKAPSYISSLIQPVFSRPY